MRLWIFSDLHLEFGWLGLEFEVPEADVCIVAGDIDVGGSTRSIEFLVEQIPPEMPVVFVAGNHEVYRSFLTDGLEAGMLKAAHHPNIHFLENGTVELGDLVIAGATLWTDFELMGSRDLAMRQCGELMNDYHAINWSKKPFSALRPMHAVRKHVESRRFLAGFLDENRDRKTVVVTHHAPSVKSIAPRFSESIYSAAFASDLEGMIADRGPDLWVHGHVHHKLDYRIGSTRVICNPRGYYGDANFADFDIGMVVEI
ncbi:metallophosphoesterase [Rhizobium sp. TH2]|uniref:metallophosphoesterase n=1 Tax=Rhizobium sp. TH2 TaxID=2775403 RepID=UPI002157E1AB|nr:metallophosphoesterase [Rhizobium sp. TH2]UVC06793.1 metallophosphoesterase [Rhizobium sp. TH2]